MSARRSMYANRLGQRGFTIVEALVALVVLAVGMLGIASLYVTTLRASGSAMSRMQAINLASDLGDRIRANRTAEAAYAGAAAANGTTCIGTGVDLHSRANGRARPVRLASGDPGRHCLARPRAR